MTNSTHELERNPGVIKDINESKKICSAAFGETKLFRHYNQGSKEEFDFSFRMKPDNTEVLSLTIQNNDCFFKLFPDEPQRTTFPLRITLTNMPWCFSLNLALDELMSNLVDNYSDWLSEQLHYTSMLLESCVENNKPLSTAFFVYATSVFFEAERPKILIITDLLLDEGQLDYREYLNKDYESYGFFCKLDGLFDVIMSSLEIIAMSGSRIRKCSLCGKYFVPSSRADEKYCDFSNPRHPNKTCKEAAKQISTENNLAKDPAAKLYNLVYNNARQVWQRSENNKDHEALLTLQDTNASYKAKLKEGSMEAAEYIEWLKEMRILFSSSKRRKND